jgi:hypothetical protein
MATKAMPTWYEKNYPNWKKILWGALRAFFASFVPVFGFLLTNVTVDNFQSKETLIKLAVSVGLASVVAGIVGLGKYLRDLFPDSEVVQKIPF